MLGKNVNEKKTRHISTAKIFYLLISISDQ